MRLLLAEDDPALAPVIANGLSELGIDVVCESSYDGALTRSTTRGDAFDVFVLDVMLPGGTGFDLCRALRARGIKAPVLMLTARDAIDDRVEGLDAGADDYVTKPFAFAELAARIRAMRRRRSSLGSDVVMLADLEVDLRHHRVRRAGRGVELTGKEFALLEFLARRCNTVVDRGEILSHVWDENFDPFGNVIEVLMRRLRRKIDDGFDIKLIHTLRGAGYRLGV
ncbi:MAG TPA: response regulator transcription factor [Gemmatimonadaceae bacterium]|jgi:two-component system copper resistance phosphate regulon response regulator CusR|nr:response regulator transcription factor [Gemmatimonadaceae bacterium]